MLYDAFLVLTVITAFMFVPTLGNAIAHYSGNVRAHAHVNHAFPLLIILGLFGLFVWQSGIVGSLGHAFENRAYAARNEPAWTPAPYVPLGARTPVHPQRRHRHARADIQPARTNAADTPLGKAIGRALRN